MISNSMKSRRKIKLLTYIRRKYKYIKVQFYIHIIYIYLITVKTKPKHQIHCNYIYITSTSTYSSSNSNDTTNNRGEFASVQEWCSSQQGSGTNWIGKEMLSENRLWFLKTTPNKTTKYSRRITRGSLMHLPHDDGIVQNH